MIAKVTTATMVTTGVASRPAPREVEAEDVVACEVCLTEIPRSAARSVEASDYVHHFCGLDCLEKWRVKGNVAK